MTPNLGLTLGKSVNFTQVSLDNSVFWKGFLTTLPSETLGYFMENSIPKELIYSLIIEELTIQTPDGVAHTYVNNPLLDNHHEFQQHLYQLIRDGFSPQQVITSTKVGAPLVKASNANAVFTA